MNSRFRQSIRFKIAIVVFIVTLITIVISWTLSNRFIDQFYITHTKNMLVQTYNSCNNFINDDESILLIKNNEIESLYGYIENPSGASVFIIDPKDFDIFSSVKMNEKSTLELKSLIDSYDVDSLKYKPKRYIIVQNKVEYGSGNEKQTGTYYDLIGLLDNDYVVVLRTSVDSITESIDFASRMFTSISFALLVFELLVVLIISNIFSRPIIEMNRVARRMANMDFSAKVEIKSRDEIGELGESMNNLSSTLELSIKDLKNANIELSNDIRKKEQIEEMRSDFLSHVSHELKTPLAIIQGYAEGLKSGVATEPEDIAYYCDVISDEASKMNELVMKLIDLNQLETGDDISIERFDITKLIRVIIKNSSVLVQDNVNIIFNEINEHYVWADSFMIEEVITNYLTNAIHYVKDDGEIKVWIDDKGDVLRVNVYNDGNNIADEDLEKLFIKFYKTDAARTRSYGGSGIGLSIVAAIMKAHNKDYGVYNTDGGVVFYFELDTNNSV